MPIKVLSPDIVNKIAAGEVVERPAAVVKELAENSLDAGARNVEIEIKAGGLELIRVSDDGCGMAPEDMRLALQRHATSKIEGYDDLLSIQSFGFRGEALPSIAAVSRLTMVSRTKDMDSAWKLESRHGGETSFQSYAASPGTAVVVEELFANVPARRKFLKSQATESRRIFELVLSLALANPDAGFRLISQGQVQYDFRPAPLPDRVRQVLGGELFSTMIEAGHGQRPLRVHGYLSKPGDLWPKRREQHLFVNGRPVSDRMISSAIYQGYGPALLGRHPAYALFLEISPREVDVNVHPAKTQVRFRDESFLFRTVRSAVEKALFKEQGGPEPGGSSLPDIPGKGMMGQLYRTAQELTPGQVQASMELYAGREDLQAPAPIQPAGPVINYWQVHGSYVFAAIKNGIIIIDQHAAHERILYEELLKTGDRRRAQQLLFPVTIELSSSEMQVYRQFQEVFAGLGFDIRPFGGNALILEGLPDSWNQGGDGAALVRGILSDLANEPDTKQEPSQRLAMSFACRAAVKAGQVLSQEEMNRLVDRLFATSTPYLDPHGRPAVIKFTLDDLERRFGRI
jgi:DNA mismatch repair protein MutL